jgi:hypothetical protein
MDGMGRADGNSARRRRGRAASRPDDDDEQSPGRPWLQTTQEWPDGEFAVRQVTGADRTYRCPGCEQEIRPGVPHVVAWPDGRVDDRRHWHTSCWQGRLRRRPAVLRARNAPRL